MDHELKKLLGDFEPGVFLAGYVGSISHGTYIPKTEPNAIDDKDVMGIMVPPKRYYLGLHTIEQLEKKVGEWDVVVYEARKMFRLLLKNNPNVLGILWLPEQCYIKKTPEGQALIDVRDMFLSKACFAPFCGYAKAQLYKMEHMAYEGYMGAKRKELVGRFGYDTKNAAHLIRLLRMGIEALTEGVLHVARHDAQELKEIKSGQWTLEQVKAEAQRLFLLMDEAFVRSKLREKPDAERAEKMLIEIVSNNLRP